MPDRSPLRLPQPDMRADDDVAARLAALARASVPTPAARRAWWRLPVAGAVVVVATGGVAWGAQSVVEHHRAAPAHHVRPGVTAAPTTAPAAAATPVRPGSRPAPTTAAPVPQRQAAAATPAPSVAVPSTLDHSVDTRTGQDQDASGNQDAGKAPSPAAGRDDQGSGNSGGNGNDDETQDSGNGAGDDGSGNGD